MFDGGSEPGIYEVRVGRCGAEGGAEGLKDVCGGENRSQSRVWEGRPLLAKGRIPREGGTYSAQHLFLGRAKRRAWTGACPGKAGSIMGLLGIEDDENKPYQQRGSMRE